MLSHAVHRGGNKILILKIQLLSGLLLEEWGGSNICHTFYPIFEFTLVVSQIIHFQLVLRENYKDFGIKRQHDCSISKYFWGRVAKSCTVNQIDFKGSKQLLYANWSVQDALWEFKFLRMNSDNSRVFTCHSPNVTCGFPNHWCAYLLEHNTTSWSPSHPDE